MSNSMETKNQTANQTKLNQMAEGQVLSDQTALDKEALQLSAYLLSYPSAEWREALTDVQAAWRAWPDSPLKEVSGRCLIISVVNRHANTRTNMCASLISAVIPICI